MKVGYIFPTRSRPLEAIAAIMMAWQLRSQMQDVEFLLSVDEDDDASGEAMHLMAKYWSDAPIQLFIRPTVAGRGIGELWNRALEYRPDLGVACMMSDRIMPITPGWDQIVSQCCINYPNRALWFNTPEGHGQICPAIPKALLDVWPDRKPYDEGYPFWYCDSAMFEIDIFMHGPPALTMPCSINYKRKETRNGRDFEFWARSFGALRPQRIELAKLIADRLGIEWVDRPHIVDEFERQDRWRVSKSEDFARQFTDPREPDEMYAAIKARAESAVAEMTGAVA